MNRRDFLTLAGAAGAAATAFPGIGFAAQPGRIPRLAVSSSSVPVERQVLGGDVNWSGWMDQMMQHGFFEGKTITYERYLVPNETAPEIVPRILATKPDAIFWGGPLQAPGLAARLDPKTPMVTHQVGVRENGVITDLGRPGGNITGVDATASPDAPAKLFGLLKEAAPQAKRFAYIVPGRDGKPFPGYESRVNVVAAAAAKLGVSVLPVFIEEVGLTEAQIAQAFDVMKANRIEAAQMGVGVTVLTDDVPRIIADLAIKAKLPMAAGPYVFADAGGLMTYGVDVPYQCRQAADYVAMILKGTKPGSLPVLQPTVYEFRLNQKTAEAIGLALPTTLIVQCSRLIA